MINILLYFNFSLPCRLNGNIHHSGYIDVAGNNKRNMNKEFKYDVALSFAGEDRAYVEKVAIKLKEKNVKVFYDRFEQTELWGKNLYTHLSDIYKEKSRFTVLFISKAYAKKSWTNHERANAQARAFRENKEYILPARFDETEIPGLPDTVGYIALKNIEPEEFSRIICKKLGIYFNDDVESLNRKKDVKKKSLESTDKKIKESTLEYKSWVPDDILRVLPILGKIQVLGWAKGNPDVGKKGIIHFSAGQELTYVSKIDTKKSVWRQGFFSWTIAWDDKEGVVLLDRSANSPK